MRYYRYDVKTWDITMINEVIISCIAAICKVITLGITVIQRIMRLVDMDHEAGRKQSWG